MMIKDKYDNFLMDGNDMLFGMQKGKPVGISYNCKKYRRRDNPDINDNVVVFGNPATGKTRSYVRPNIESLASNMVIVEENGVLYKEYKDYLEKNGYTVYLFDTTDMNSNRYDIIASCRRNNKNISCLVDYLLKMTAKDESDIFYKVAEKKLVSGIISCLVKNPEASFFDLYLLALGIVEERLENICKEHFDVIELENLQEVFKMCPSRTQEKLQTMLPAELKNIILEVNPSALNDCCGDDDIGIFDRYDYETPSIDISLFNKEKVCIFVELNWEENYNKNFAIPLFISCFMNDIQRMCHDLDIVEPLERHLQIFLDAGEKYLGNIAGLENMFCHANIYNVGISFISRWIPDNLRKTMSVIWENAEVKVFTGEAELIAVDLLPEEYQKTVRSMDNNNIFVWVKGFKPVVLEKIDSHSNIK